MGDAAKKVLDDALALSEDERAEVAAELLASLDGEEDADWFAAWDAELKRRVDEVDRGDVSPASWADVRGRLRARRGA